MAGQVIAKGLEPLIDAAWDLYSEGLSVAEITARLKASSDMLYTLRLVSQCAYAGAGLCDTCRAAVQNAIRKAKGEA